MFLNTLIGELLKLKRYRILWFAYGAVILSVLLALFQTKSGGKSVLFQNFADAVIWNNATLVLPFCITLIGCYLIRREWMEDTDKNLLTIPISWKYLIIIKLVVTSMLAISLGVVSLFSTIVCAFVFQVEAISLLEFGISLLKILCSSFLLAISVFPFVVALKPSLVSFLSSIVLSFVYGFVGIFVAQRYLGNFYPTIASLNIIGYEGSASADFLISILTLASTLLLSIVLIFRAESRGKR